MPLRRRLSHSIGQSRPSDGTREHNDSGNLSGSGPPVSPTGSIESLPNNNSTSSSGDDGGGGVGGGGRSSRSSSTERESTATDHVDHPVTPRAFSLDSARTAGDPDAHEQLTLPRPWSVAEPSRPSLDDAATDALAVRRHVTFLNALARIGRENSSLREQLGMRSTRSSEEEDGPPPVVAATAAPAPPELTALRNSQLSSATPTETALGGCGTARNGNDDRRSEGSSNSSGNDNGNDNNSNSATTPVAMPSTRPPMTVSEMVRERRHRQQREPQQQEQSQQQPQREQEDAPQRISPPLPLQPAIALADMEDAARGPNFSIAGGGRRLPRFRRHQRSGNAASTESTRESTESARRSTEPTRRSAAIVDGIPRAPAPETRGFRWARPSPVDPATDTSTDGWRIASDIQTGFSLTNPRPDRAMSPDASGPNGSMFTTPSIDLSGRRFSFRRVPAGAGVDAHSNGTSNDSAAPMRRPRSRRVLRRRNSGWLEDESDRLLLASIPGSGGAAAAATNSDGGRAGGGAGGTSAEGGREGETAEESTRQGIAATIHQLHKASVVGDLTAISRFIKAGGDLEAQSFCGRTALHYAAFYGHADVARALILAGANVCSRGGGNSTPLHFAAWGGNKRVVRLLLDYGADVEARDTEGNAPQAYSEDDELYSMLVDARRKPLPLPASALSEALHARPFTTLATYAAVVQLIIVFAVATLFLAGTGGGSRWGALIGASPPQAATSAASSTGLAATAFRFSAGLGGKAAAAAARNAGVSGGEGAGGVGSVPMAVFISAFTLALLAGLAPALLYATGFKRRTQAYWRSMKDRDREIVHLRQREQAAGGWSPAFHIGTVPGTAGVATATTSRAHSGAAVAPAAVPAPGGAGSSFATQSPRNGGISRGEQAGQAVIARLSRLQAASAAAGIGGANPSGAGVRGLFGGDGPHVRQHLTMQQLQVQVQGYQQALMAMGGTAGDGGGGGGGSGQSSNAARRCVQVAQ